MKELDELKKILDDDEEVKLHYKPNKTRYVVVNILFSLLFLLIAFSGMFVVGLLGVLDVIKFTGEGGERDLLAPIIFLVISAPILLVCILTTIGYIVRYKRALFVVTNKRLIIRSGFIGVDYKSIELKYVGLVNVRVDFLDKLSGGKTGTITFASAAIPMTNGQNNTNGAFCFACVENPYEVYKQVKSFIPEND